jgi:hypothetical protein
MYVILRNGQYFAEYAGFGVACTAARKAAYVYRLSLYTIHHTASPDKTLYRIEGGMCYIIPNPPAQAAA